MPTLLFKNNASTTLSGSINNTQTTFTVASSSGFPTIAGSDYFYATMYETSGATEINIEIVKVTGVSGSTWTVVRGQDGTIGRSRDGISSCYVELRWTAAAGDLMLQKDNNLSDLTNASTARTNLGLGTMATQAASNVAITGGSISGVTFTNLDSTTTFQDNLAPTKQFRFEASGITAGNTRILTIPDADGTLATTAVVAAGYQPLDGELTAISGLAANGLIARTSATTAAARTLTAPAAGITVTNGDGVSGNPTLALANDLAAVESINTTGFVKRTAADSWTAAAIADGDLPSALTGKTYNGLTLSSRSTGLALEGGTANIRQVVFEGNFNFYPAGGDPGTYSYTLPASNGTLAFNNQTFFLGTTSIAINRTSASISLTGVNIDGSAGSTTNIASGVLGAVPYQSGAGVTALLAPNTTTTRNFLRMTGTGTVGAAPAWDTVTKTDVGLANVENTALSTWAGSTSLVSLGTVTSGTWNATAIGISYGGTGATSKAAGFNALSPVTTLGDIIYGDGANSNTRLAGNTTSSKRFLTQTGTGTVSAAPGWNAIVDGDIPSALTGKTYNGLTLTANATGFQVAGGTTSKTLVVQNNLTLAGTDGSTLNIGAGGTLGTGAYATIANYAALASANTFATNQHITGSSSLPMLRITQTGTGAAILVEDDTSTDSTPFSVSSTGGVSIGTQSGGANALLISMPIIGDPSAGYAVSANSVIQTSASAWAGYFASYLQTQAASWTLPTAYHFLAQQGTIGAGSTVTNQYGFFVDSNVTGATNNYGFYGNLASATGRWNFYANGTAQNYFGGDTTVAANLILSGTSRRIQGDFSNATFASRTFVQTSTANGSTEFGAIPNGTANGSFWIAYNNSNPGNSGIAFLGINNSSAILESGRVGSGTTLPLNVQTDGFIRARFGASGGFDMATGLREARVAMGASDIDVRAGNYFTRTISATTTFTVSNVPAAGTAASFILDLTNGGSQTVNWWSGVKWAGGTAPTLTAAGRDVLGFFTHDAGTTWTGLLLGKDVK